MLRSRDFVAAIALVWLTFSTRDLEDVTATVHLSFYAPHGLVDNPTTHPVIFDVDGDGKSEALAFWTPGWRLRVLDLRPASVSKQGQTAFIPNVLLESSPVIPPDSPRNAQGDRIDQIVSFEPVAVATGQLLTRNIDKTTKSQKPPRDKTVQYFCGTDWHDASERCAVHCPSGQSSDCPENERCFADTPCRAGAVAASKDSIADTVDSYHTTPAGGWPSIFTVWSTGNVTLHSVTGEHQESSKPKKLDLKLLWNVAPLVPTSYTMEWEDVAVTFVDTNSDTSVAGLIVITGSASAVPNPQAELEGEDEPAYVWGSFTLAIDALSGKTLWTSFAAKELEDALVPKNKEELPLPAVAPRGSTSLSRRRSLTAGILANGNSARTKNCWSEFRRSVLKTALPYQYWGSTLDTKISALHFDHQAKSPHKHRKAHKKVHNANSMQKRSFFGNKKHHKEHLHYGRPNVVVTHTHQGLQVFALKNGKPICHLALRAHTLYTDLNHDGTLDSVQIATGEQDGMYDDDAAAREHQWMENLARRVHAVDETGQNETETAESPRRLCHILALAGVPAKEELFSAPLCEHAGANHIEGAPLLVLPHGKKQDIVASVNTGEITRWASSGRRVWHWQYAFGTWNDPSLVLLERLQAPTVVASARPMVWAGEESVAIVSAATGEILSAAPFPQASELRPQLVDFNGDGISDIVVVTGNAIWGYGVQVDTTGSVPYRIGYGLLLMGLMLALLRNQMGPRPGKRSTDR